MLRNTSIHEHDANHSFKSIPPFLFPSEDGFYDPSIKWVSELKHIEPPKKKF